MSNSTRSRIGDTPEDLLRSPLPGSSGGAQEPDADSHKTGILPSQELESLAGAATEIRASKPIQPDQIQPASLDLRLGPVAYRVRASFLPGKNATVKERLQDLTMQWPPVRHESYNASCRIRKVWNRWCTDPGYTA